MPSTRSACTRVKPLAASHCSCCSAVVSATGSSTGKVNTRRGSPAAARRRSSRRGWSPVSCRTGSAVWRRTTARRARTAASGGRSASVIVPTVLRRGAHQVGLVDRDRRRHAVDAVDRRAVHTVEELARVGAEGLDVAPLALGVQRVEHQARLARTAGTGDDRQFAVCGRGRGSSGCAGGRRGADDTRRTWGRQWKCCGGRIFILAAGRRSRTGGGHSTLQSVPGASRIAEDP